MYWFFILGNKNPEPIDVMFPETSSIPYCSSELFNIYNLFILKYVWIKNNILLWFKSFFLYGAGIPQLTWWWEVSRGCLYFLRNIHLVLLDAFNDEKSRRIIYLRNIVLVFNGWRWKFAMPYLFSEYLFIIYCSFTPSWW